MTWIITADRPIYLQLVEQLELAIVAGEYRAGGKLPSVRELAAEAAVNPNTMQKAFSELERTGLIITQRTSGRIVTEDKQMIFNARMEFAEEQIVLFLTKMQSLGFHREEIIQLLSEKKEEESS